jgi:predicted NBD/HSP70 family sugar kinase
MIERNSTDSKNAGIPNEKLVLQILRQHGELSQVDICKLTGLGSSTASYITARLREKNLILEKAGQSTKRGAKPVILSINPNGRFIISISMNPGHVVVGLFDFMCKLVEKADVSVDSDNSVENICGIAEITAHGLLGKYRAAEQDLLGIGVALSGTVSPDGVVKLSSPLGWKDVPLRQILSTKFQCEVEIYSTRVRFLAEIGIDGSLASKSVLYLNVADGVGGTLFADGRVVGGATGRFAELGHIVVEPDGPLCGCGHTGCLEAVISGPALSKRIRKDITAGTKTILAEKIDAKDTAESVLSKLADALRQGDTYSVSLREQTAEHLSKIAAMAINCFDPQVVMLAGYVINHSIDYFAAAIKSRLANDVYDNQSREIEITQARAGKDVLINAVALAVLQDAPDVA